MVHHVHPRLVEEFRIAEEVKKGGSGEGKGKARASTPSGDDDYRAIGSNSAASGPYFYKFCLGPLVFAGYNFSTFIKH